MSIWTRVYTAAIRVFVWPTHAIRVIKISWWSHAARRAYPGRPRAQGFYLAPRLISIWGALYVVRSSAASLNQTQRGSDTYEMFVGVLVYCELEGLIKFQGGERPW